VRRLVIKTARPNRSTPIWNLYCGAYDSVTGTQYADIVSLDVQLRPEGELIAVAERLYRGDGSFTPPDYTIRETFLVDRFEETEVRNSGR
jgi:hypothetical protein